MTKRRLALGARGEDLAARWYVARGYRVLARNWRCSDGELDLVLGARNLIVFCEVKTRSSTRYGSPFDAVGPAKQRKVRTLALAWLAATGTRSSKLRFDVAGIVGRNITVIESAF